jgi:hypothetical protein
MANEAYWTYQAATPTPTVNDLPAGAFKGTQAQFETLSPGMRREILRAAQRPAFGETGA